MTSENGVQAVSQRLGAALQRPQPAGVRLRRRLDRIFPLADASSYRGSPFFDMVSFLPCVDEEGPQELRFWLKTRAENPVVEINRTTFRPVGRSSRDPMWLDFGIIQEEPALLGVQGFGIFRFYGLSAAEARESWFAVTRQTAIELFGDTEEVERTLWGISRGEAGRTTLTPSRVRAGSAATFDLRYEAGPRGLPPGSLLRVALPLCFSAPQVKDQDAPGFIEIAAATEPAELLHIGRSGESHEKNDVLYRLPRGLPPTGALSIRYRTDFVYLTSGRWSAMERRYWYSPLAPLAVAVAVDERQVFVPPLEANGHALEVEPGPPKRLQLFLPGRRKWLPSLRLTGLFTDRYRNPPARGPAANDLGLRLRGPKEIPICSSDIRFDSWFRFRAAIPRLEPGVYRAEAFDRSTGRVLAVSNPMEILADSSTASPIYWGEIHCHSEQSDGAGRYDELFRFARELAGLDFGAGTDHACYFTDNEWRWMQDVANCFNDPGRFVSLIGYEWAGRQGHRNVYTSRDRLDLFRGMYPGQEDLNVVYRHFEGREDAVGGPHVGHTRDFFDGHNPAVQRFLEIYSMWGNYESLGMELLARGARIGFTGGGDCHEGRCGLAVEDLEGQGRTPHTFAPGLKYKCGLTAALLPELSRKALLGALRTHRTYATTGARILIDFAVSGLPMGAEGAVPEKPALSATVKACAPIERLEVFRDGRQVAAFPGGESDMTFEWRDDDVSRGEHSYVLKVVQTDGELAWTSPVWARIEA